MAEVAPSRRCAAANLRGLAPSSMQRRPGGGRGATLSQWKSFAIGKMAVAMFDLRVAGDWVMRRV